MRLRAILTAAAVIALTASPALAAKKRHHHTHVRDAAGNRVDLRAADPRPSQWCAWWLRRHLNIPRSMFRPWDWNLAWAFRYIGEPASRPCPGCIVVWHHHVGIIDGECRGKVCMVLSGNDGHQVRRRERSVSGAIFRRPPSVMAMVD